MEIQSPVAGDLKYLEDKRRLREFFARFMFGFVMMWLILRVAPDRYKAGDTPQQFALFQNYVLLFFLAFGILALRQFPRSAIAALGFACLYYALLASQAGVWTLVFDTSRGSSNNPLLFIRAFWALTQWAIMVIGFVLAWPLRKNPYSLQ